MHGHCTCVWREAWRLSSQTYRVPPVSTAEPRFLRRRPVHAVLILAPQPMTTALFCPSPTCALRPFAAPYCYAGSTALQTALPFHLGCAALCRAAFQCKPSSVHSCWRAGPPGHHTHRQPCRCVLETRGAAMGGSTVCSMSLPSHHAPLIMHAWRWSIAG